jgi:hypothetical protein
MTRTEAINDFFMTALKGESKTYNDHNWYTSAGLKGYIEGRNKNAYPLLKKALSEYTIGEVKAFQARSRDASGQLWATGRYQIIPSTLKGVQANVGLPDSAKYNQENQDKLAFQLLMGRPTLSKYIKGTIPDTTANLQKASLEMAMIWSSIGVPYPTNGKQTNQSYYSHDKASVKSETIQAKLQELRNNLGGKITEVIEEGAELLKKKNLIPTIIITTALLTGSYALYKILKRKK